MVNSNYFLYLLLFILVFSFFASFCTSALGSQRTLVTLCGHKCVFYLELIFHLFHAVKPIVHLNRLSIIWNVICPSHFLYIVFHVVLAGFFASCCTGLLGGRYSTLVRLCEVEEGMIKECLAEEHLFLVLYGMFMVRTYFFFNLKFRKEFMDQIAEKN